MTWYALAEPFTIFWIYLKHSLTMQIFMASAFILVVGIAMQVTKTLLKAGKQKRQQDATVPTKRFQPRLRIILVTFVGCTALLTASLQTLHGLPPFDKPYQWLFLCALFLLTGALGILAELKWEHGKDYPFAFLVGTAMGFMFLSFKFSMTTSYNVQVIGITLVTVANFILAKRIFFPVWTVSAKVLSIVTFMGWILLYVNV